MCMSETTGWRVATPRRFSRLRGATRFEARVVESTDRRSVRILGAGGYDRSRHLVTILVTTSGEQVVENEVLVEVQEVA